MQPVGGGVGVDAEPLRVEGVDADRVGRRDGVCWYGISRHCIDRCVVESGQVEYNAIERTSEFLGEISKEQDYQRGGNVDDSQICELGRQFGVDLVCVTDITKFQEKFYVQARLIDVEKAIVLATAREIAQLENLDDIMKLASTLAQNLINADVTYVLQVENTQTVPLEIFVNNEVVGQVPPKSTRTFDMPISKIGKIEAKPTKGMFKKTMENTINKMKAQDTVSFVF